MRWMSYSELLQHWAEADLTARAYELTWAGTHRPEHQLVMEALRRSADAWERLARQEASHMQLRMPRV